MRLYHYTCLHHLPAILSAGHLRTTESNIGSPSSKLPPCGEHVGPNVVWLTNQAIVGQGHGLEPGPLNPTTAAFDKFRLRFTVETEAMPWRIFAQQHGINRRWYQALDQAGDYTARHWWVATQPVAREHWLALTNMALGCDLNVHTGL